MADELKFEMLRKINKGETDTVHPNNANELVSSGNFTCRKEQCQIGKNISNIIIGKDLESI